MPYEWDFYTRGRDRARVRGCYRGPMIEVEVQMSKPFETVFAVEPLRRSLLRNIVTTDLIAVRTREVVLRVLNGDLGPIIDELYPTRKYLQVLICEKRRATAIDSDLSNLPLDYEAGARSLTRYGVNPLQVDLILAALTSESPILRVGGRCAVILEAAFIELGQ